MTAVYSSKKKPLMIAKNIKSNKNYLIDDENISFHGWKTNAFENGPQHERKFYPKVLSDIVFHIRSSPW